MSEAQGVEELIRMMQTQADAMTCYASTLNYPPNTTAKWLNAGVERLRQQAERIADLTLKLSNAELMCGHHKTAIGERDERIAALEAALKELVTLKNLADENEAGMSLGLWRNQLAQDDYKRRKPLAWASARALLGDSK